MFDWSKYLAYAEVYQLKKGTVLFRQGDRTSGFYYVKDGKVKISVLREDGYERIIDFVFPGSLVGEQMINNTASFTTAKLIVDSTLFYFSKEEYELLVNKHPVVSQHFETSLIKKIRLLANINSILNAPLEIQLAYFILNLYEKENTEVLEFSQTSLSKYIGKSRVSVWKVLKEWRNDKVIEIKNQTITIKNINQLRQKLKSG